MDVELHASECLAVLMDCQNEDGGWGYRERSASRVEPTCWAYRALSSAHDSGIDPVALRRARRFLLDSQAKEGFWTATPEMNTGNWVTSLACAVLGNDPEAQAAVSMGLTWLCNDYPFDSKPLVRFIRKLSGASRFTEMSDAFRGWGWTPSTSSWVEPTAFALMSFEACEPKCFPKAAARRAESAVSVLYDRMCPGGGWNCGNPRVYGVDGEPLVLPTSWALIALRNYPEHERRSLSLAWLERRTLEIESPSSLAAAILCLESYGRQLPDARIRLQEYAQEDPLHDGVHVLAWICLALNPDRAWPSQIGGRA